jgi:hypothetical protein
MPTSRWQFCHVLWALGALGLPWAHYCLFAAVEPFFTGVYSLLWWSFIFACDGLVYLLRRRSLLHDRPWEFLLLALWSTPVWLLFEVLNFRLENWSYVMVPWELSWGGLLLIPAYATVLPGVFEVTELVVGVIERWAPSGRIAGRPFTVTRRNLAIQVALGVAMLILPLLWPEDFFPLIWGFAFLLLDPICYALRGRSLLGQLASGDNTRLVALLVAGFVCGGLWEAWNISARTKWIYTVPFFDELKLFEMPVLGFLGFPPFVLECYAIVNALALLRGGRHWESSTEQNRSRRGLRLTGIMTGWTALALACPLAALGIFQWTVLSFSIPIDRYLPLAKELSPAARRCLREQDVRHTHQYLRLSSRPEAISPALHRRLQRLSRMSEIKGMGLVHAQELVELGIRTPGHLAGADAGRLARQLNRRLGRSWTVRPDEVKVWIRGAKGRAKRAG